MRNSTSYGLAHTRTFRRSSKMLFDIWGSNLQNLEKSIRQLYIPDGFEYGDIENKCRYWLQTGDLTPFSQEELEKIRVFVQVDQSGAEALIVAYLCRPADYRQLFLNNVKPHVYVALKLFKDVWTRKLKEKGGMIEDFDINVIDNTPIAALKQNPFWHDLDLLIKDSDNWKLTERYYYFAKQTCHSANYGIRGPTFQMNVLDKSGGKVALSKEDAERFLNVYRSLFPEIVEWNKQVLRQVEESGILYNLHGFPYYITDYLDSKRLAMNEKEWISWVPQSTVGEITRIAFSDLQLDYIEPRKKKWDIMADTHDSFMCQCPLYEVKECITTMQQYMNQEFTSPFDGVKFRMKSEANIGFNWCPEKKKNELGLQSPKWLYSA